VCGGVTVRVPVACGFVVHGYREENGYANTAPGCDRAGNGEGER